MSHERSRPRCSAREHGAAPAAGDAAHPPLRGEVRRAVQRRKIRGFLHLYIGEEAVAVGAMQALTPDDAIVATYREHGHALARGVRPMRSWRRCTASRRAAAAAAAARCTSSTPPRASTAATPSSAAGCRSRSAWRSPTSCGPPRVTACFFGDGAVAEGEFHESLNLAALWRCRCCSVREQPVRDGHALERAPSRRPTCAKAASYGMPADGRRHGRAGGRGGRARAVERGARRQGSGVPRAAHLSLPRALDVRPRAVSRQGRGRGVEAARSRSSRSRARCARRACSTTTSSASSTRRSRRESRGGRLRRGGTWEPVEDLTRTSTRPACRGAAMTGRDGPATRRSGMTYREAAAQALRDALQRDERVFLMGEDVGRYGGCVRRQQGPARGVRARAHPRHAAVGVGVRRRRHRRGARRHAADRRGDDGELQPARARSDREQRGDDPAHVRRAVQRAARDPHGHRRRAPARGAALAQPRGVVRAHPGIKHRGAGHASRMRAACCGPRSRTPTRCSSSSTQALYNMEGELAGRRGAVDIDRAAVRRRGDDVTLVTYGGSPVKTLQAASWPAQGSSRGDRPAHAAAARHGHDPGIGPPHAPRVIVDEGWRSGSLSAEITTARGAGVLRSRCAGGTRVHRRGADPVSQAPRGCGAAATGLHPRRLAAHDGRRRTVSPGRGPDV
jgi:2-oxoisovalerate dehydrogenase E1 component